MLLGASSEERASRHTCLVHQGQEKCDSESPTQSVSLIILQPSVKLDVKEAARAFQALVSHSRCVVGCHCRAWRQGIIWSNSYFTYTTLAVLLKLSCRRKVEVGLVFCEFCDHNGAPGGPWPWQSSLHCPIMSGDMSHQRRVQQGSQKYM